MLDKIWGAIDATKLKNEMPVEEVFAINRLPDNVREVQLVLLPVFELETSAEQEQTLS